MGEDTAEAEINSRTVSRKCSGSLLLRRCSFSTQRGFGTRRKLPTRTSAAWESRSFGPKTGGGPPRISYSLCSTQPEQTGRRQLPRSDSAGSGLGNGTLQIGADL